MTLRLTYSTAYIARGGTTHGPLERTAGGWACGANIWRDDGTCKTCDDDSLDLITAAPTPPAFATSA